VLALGDNPTEEDYCDDDTDEANPIKLLLLYLDGIAVRRLLRRSQSSGKNLPVAMRTDFDVARYLVAAIWALYAHSGNRVTAIWTSLSCRRNLFSALCAID
jgi:hypothetical protein